MARTQQVKEKGNAHTTKYEKDTPVETQGFYVFLWLPTKCGAILRRACVYFRSRTSCTLPSSKPRAPCLVCISQRQDGCTLLVTLAFPNDRTGVRYFVALAFPPAITAKFSKKFVKTVDFFNNTVYNTT